MNQKVFEILDRLNQPGVLEETVADEAQLSGVVIDLLAHVLREKLSTDDKTPLNDDEADGDEVRLGGVRDDVICNFIAETFDTQTEGLKDKLKVLLDQARLMSKAGATHASADGLNDALESDLDRGQDLIILRALIAKYNPEFGRSMNLTVRAAIAETLKNYQQHLQSVIEIGDPRTVGKQAGSRQLAKEHFKWIDSVACEAFDAPRQREFP